MATFSIGTAELMNRLRAHIDRVTTELQTHEARIAREVLEQQAVAMRAIGESGTSAAQAARAFSELPCG